MRDSKPLSNDDHSGFQFAQEMLQGDKTYAINFDRIQYHPEQGYIIFEYLRCHESQLVNPHTSHPNRYFYKNTSKFTALFRIAQDLKATLYLVNYAVKGSAHEDKIRVMKVLSVDPERRDDPVETENCETTREKFSTWFRKLNQACR